METMALLDQFFAKLDVVENLAVEGNPQRAIRIRHGLTPAVDIDDAEASMAQTSLSVGEDAGPVRTAVADLRDHTPQQVGLDPSSVSINNPSDSAHRSAGS